MFCSIKHVRNKKCKIFFQKKMKRKQQKVSNNTSYMACHFFGFRGPDDKNNSFTALLNR